MLISVDSVSVVELQKELFAVRLLLASAEAERDMWNGRIQSYLVAAESLERMLDRLDERQADRGLQLS